MLSGWVEVSESAPVTEVSVPGEAFSISLHISTSLLKRRFPMLTPLPYSLPKASPQTVVMIPCAARWLRERRSQVLGASSGVLVRLLLLLLRLAVWCAIRGDYCDRGFSVMASGTCACGMRGCWVLRPTRVSPQIVTEQQSGKRKDFEHNAGGDERTYFM